jgi:hypothetical protein
MQFFIVVATVFSFFVLFLVNADVIVKKDGLSYVEPRGPSNASQLLGYYPDERLGSNVVPQIVSSLIAHNEQTFCRQYLHKPTYDKTLTITKTSSTTTTIQTSTTTTTTTARFNYYPLTFFLRLIAL